MRRHLPFLGCGNVCCRARAHPFFPPRPRGVTRPRLLAPRRLTTRGLLNEPERSASPTVSGWPISGQDLARAPTRKRLATAALDGGRAAPRRGPVCEVPPRLQKSGSQTPPHRQRGCFAGAGEAQWGLSGRQRGQGVHSFPRDVHSGRAISSRWRIRPVQYPRWVDGTLVAAETMDRRRTSPLLPMGRRINIPRWALSASLLDCVGQSSLPTGEYPKSHGLRPTEQLHSMGLPYWLVGTRTRALAPRAPAGRTATRPGTLQLGNDAASPEESRRMRPVRHRTKATGAGPRRH